MALLPFLLSSLLTSAAVAQDLLTEAQIEVRNRLRVPESAQFDNLRAAQKTVNDKKAQVVCGNVNAKNSAGQLAGPSPLYLWAKVEKLCSRAITTFSKMGPRTRIPERGCISSIARSRVQHHASHSRDTSTVGV